MQSFIIAALTSGILFGIMDGLINGNPYALKLLECYKPIAKQKINIPVGFMIDITFGFAISYIYLLLIPILTTEKCDNKWDNFWNRDVAFQGVHGNDFKMDDARCANQNTALHRHNRIDEDDNIRHYK